MGKHSQIKWLNQDLVAGCESPTVIQFSDSLEIEILTLPS